MITYEDFHESLKELIHEMKKVPMLYRKRRPMMRLDHIVDLHEEVSLSPFLLVREGNRPIRIYAQYVLRDMISSAGGFYSAEDADSEGEEGKFYLWAKNELEKILNKEELELITEVFNVEESGNFLEEATGRKTGHNILHVKKNFDLPNQNRVEEIRKRLFTKREQRIHPHKDDKILTDWNGLMITALAKGARVFQEQVYLDAAKKAVDFILSNLRDSNGRLLHRYKDGSSEIHGYLTDYAFTIWGLIELYESTFNIDYLRTALELHNIQIENFWDNKLGGFYFTGEDNEELLTSFQTVLQSEKLRIKGESGASCWRERRVFIRVS